MIKTFFQRRVSSGYPPPYESNNFDCTYAIDESRISEISLVVEISPPASP
ncbi:MAG TPA: hypothetical protein VNL91_00955 [Thermoanaerobaculia bacterium]|nr:hypothetical protein [Thermoanaerobaculia bacterium]